ncbi:MAG: class II fumarate hydratase [Arcobacteraceae bacterium]|nr:class II fumarate hydratase [Arcobacteraceae bacterium]
MNTQNTNINPLWGDETQKSLNNFNIGIETMPDEFIKAYAYLKKCCAIVNNSCRKLEKQKSQLIVQVCNEIIGNKHTEQFPLHVWQTGSGTHTNMNLNEVIANRATQLDNSIPIHPNDDVNMSQSSNDTFPTAMKIATTLQIPALLEAIDTLIESFQIKQKEFEGIVKVGRTHLQDAVPLFLSDELSGYISMLEHSKSQIKDTLKYINELPIGATAVGNGINTPSNFSQQVCDELNSLLQTQFISHPNKFHSLTSHDSETFLSGALNALATNMMKIANDIRWLSSGPKCGLGELTIPANEKGSSIMPGKVNPTQAEAITMIATQVMGNHTTISMASSQGNFELNVFKPVIIYNLLQSIRLLTDGINSFSKNCIDGLGVNKEKIKENLNNAFMCVTALNPHIGYKNSEKIVQFAYKNNLTLKESALQLALLSEEEFDKYMVVKDIAKCRK